MSDFIKKYFDDLLLLIGIALVVVGIYLIYVPLSLIVAGIGSITLAYFYAQNKEGDDG